MALPPKFAGHKLEFAPPPPSSAGVAHTTHTLELYLDYACPYSAKLYNTLYKTVVPAIRSNQKLAANLAIIFRQQVQPWHPSSTLLHEAGLAVLQLSPDKFWTFSQALFDVQKDFFDANVVNETRNQTYKRLAQVAASAGVDADQFYRLLEVPDKPAADGSLNVGNQVTDTMKVITKMNRLIGVHVTPTGVFNGVVQDISSGWTVEQWSAWLEKNVV